MYEPVLISQRSWSADYFFMAGISPNDLAEQERLPSPRYVSNHFLFDTSVFSLTLIFHCSASRRELLHHGRRAGKEEKREIRVVSGETNLIPHIDAYQL